MELTIIQFLAIAGVILSTYFLFVKYKNNNTKNYKALCDINNLVSCSKAANSKTSVLAILPNALYGLFFYTIIFYLTSNQIIFYLSLLASLASIYLIYLSIKIKVICPVCISTYIINFLLFYFCYINIY